MGNRRLSRVSSRDLIVELAETEDTLRTAQEPDRRVAWHPTSDHWVLVLRQQEIRRELRRRRAEWARAVSPGGSAASTWHAGPLHAWDE